MITEITEAISFTKTLLDLFKSAKLPGNGSDYIRRIEEHREKLVKLLSVVAASEESKLALTDRVSQLTQQEGQVFTLTLA